MKSKKQVIGILRYNQLIFNLLKMNLYIVYINLTEIVILIIEQKEVVMKI